VPVHLDHGSGNAAAQGQESDASLNLPQRLLEARVLRADPLVARRTEGSPHVGLRLDPTPDRSLRRSHPPQGSRLSRSLVQFPEEIPRLLVLTALKEFDPSPLLLLDGRRRRL
jgi:hypothetical protein